MGVAAKDTPRQTKFEGGIRNQRVVSWSVSWTDSHGIWHIYLPWDLDVQDTFLDSGRKCVAMVTVYYVNKLGGNLVSRTTSSGFDRFSWNLAQMLALGCFARFIC